MSDDDLHLFDVLDGIEAGDLRALAQWIRNGRPLDDAMLEELAMAIEQDVVGPGPNSAEATADRRAKKSAAYEEKLKIGAFVFARAWVAPRGYMPRIRQAAAKRFHVSPAKAKAAYEWFGKEWAMGWPDPRYHWGIALRELCAEQGLDFMEVHTGLYSAKKWRLKF